MLGGTAWVGHAVARAARDAGHAVTCVARRSAVPEGTSLVNADRDRDDALVPLSTRRWDAVLDLATEPGHVRRAVRDLAPVADRFLLVSSVNVYASLAEAGIAEDAPLQAPLAQDTMGRATDYGPAKVAGERAVLAGFGRERSVIVRPGLIGGPGDPTGRSSYWPLRLARPSNREGRVIAPDITEQAVSIIDVRDLVSWMVRLIEVGTVGTFNAVGDPVSFGEQLADASSAAGFSGEIVWRPGEWLRNHQVAQWMGPRSLPLWLSEGSVAGLSAVANERARGAGLGLRPLAQTLADTLAWGQENAVPTVRGAGLTDAEERELLALV